MLPTILAVLPFAAGCLEEIEQADLPDASEESLVAAVKCMAGEELPGTGKYLQRAAEMGSLMGMRLYGNYLHTQNDTGYLEWWEKAVAEGDAQSETNLGIAYLHGYGVEPDTDKGYRFIKSAAEKNDVTARYNLGLLLLLGLPEIGVAKDEKTGAVQLSKAALAGHLESMMELAFLTKKNGRYTKRSVKWLEKAHRGGHQAASFTLGYMYKVGEGVGIDEEEAFEHYVKAAKAGHAGAQYEVGLMYLYDTGVEGDIALGKYWMEKAAKQEHAKAMHNYASLLLKDDDPKKQLLPESQRTTSQKHDEKLALSMYAAAASKGISDSIYILGFLHYRGHYNMEKSTLLAARYWAEAARGGYIKALSALRKLAEDGDVNGLYYYGEIHEIGVENLPKDVSEARALYEEAAEKGHEDAIKKLSEEL